MVSKYEEQYISNLANILANGAREKNERTGIETLRLPFTEIIIDLEKEFPILCSKKVFWKSAVDEILWIMQKQSNKTADLNSHIWDKWTGADGTIGKSYGYQIGRTFFKDNRIYTDQVDYILRTLEHDQSNRQCVIDMWNVGELGEMNLVPCTYSSVWNVIGGKLNCMLVQRSADYPIGVPFDTTQYAVLTHLFARHLGVRVGKLTHVMGDSHIYTNQIDGVKVQLKQFESLKKLHDNLELPQIEISGTANFWDVNIEDISIKNYSPLPVVKYEIAI